MDRRGFIKQTTGGVITIKKAILWAALFLILLLLINSDFSTSPISIFSLSEFKNSNPDISTVPDSSPSAIKIIAVIIAALLVLTILVWLLDFGLKKLKQQLPQSVRFWLDKNGKRIEYIFTFSIFFYMIYRAIIKEKYFMIIIYSIIALLSVYKEWYRVKLIKKKSGSI